MDAQLALPREPTSLDISKKRKHHEIADEAHDAQNKDNATKITIASDDIIVALKGNEQTNETHSNDGCDCGHHHDHQRSDENEDEDDVDDDSEDEDDYLEDILDSMADGPFPTSGMTEQDATILRTRLREIGVHAFFEETLSQRNMNPRALGAAFGLDPDMEVDDETFLRILGVCIMRMFYRRQKLPQFNNIDDVAGLLQSSRKIMVITGAGISTSLGIPDFRSKGTGFYEMIRNEGLSEGEEVFDIRNFDDDPSTFYRLARHILPTMNECSPTHAFIRLLQDKERLQTNYTQNIDNIEAIAGIDQSRVIQCHGSFRSATCRTCGHQVAGADIFEDIRSERVAVCKACVARLADESKNTGRSKKMTAQPKRGHNFDADSDSDAASDSIPQPGVMKPDITFFGEQLPSTFFTRFTEEDATNTDLVLVIGTSLKVAPVSEMPNYIPHDVPHVYISKEPIRHVEFDVQLLGQCDHVVTELCRRAGWRADLKHEMVKDDEVMQVLAVEGKQHHWAISPKTDVSSAVHVDDAAETVAP